jgi:hypothetical protein
LVWSGGRLLRNPEIHAAAGTLCGRLDHRRLLRVMHVGADEEAARVEVDPVTEQVIRGRGVWLACP